MKKLIENLAALLKVKTLVTIAVIVVFVVLALTGSISADNVMIIISMVVSFYFGTQHQKADSAVIRTAVADKPVEYVTEQATPVAASVDKGTYSQIHPDSE